MIDPDMAALFEELNEATRAALQAMADDDMQAWAGHASRAAEIHAEVARRNGWCEQTGPATPGGTTP